MLVLIYAKDLSVLRFQPYSPTLKEVPGPIPASGANNKGSEPPLYFAN